MTSVSQPLEEKVQICWGRASHCEEEVQPLMRIKRRRGGGSIDRDTHTWTLNRGCSIGRWSSRGGRLEAFKAPTGVVALLLVGASVAVVELEDFGGVMGATVDYVYGEGRLLR